MWQAFYELNHLLAPTKFLTVHSEESQTRPEEAQERLVLCAACSEPTSKGQQGGAGVLERSWREGDGPEPAQATVTAEDPGLLSALLALVWTCLLSDPSVQASAFIVHTSNLPENTIHLTEQPVSSRAIPAMPHPDPPVPIPPPSRNFQCAKPQDLCTAASSSPSLYLGANTNVNSRSF